MEPEPVNPSLPTGRVDTSRPHFELVHSFYKETVARVGYAAAGTGLAIEFVAGPAASNERVRADVAASIAARLRDCPGAAESLFDRLRASCAGPENLYARVHWYLFDPDLLPPGQPAGPEQT